MTKPSSRSRIVFFSSTLGLMQRLRQLGVWVVLVTVGVSGASGCQERPGKSKDDKKAEDEKKADEKKAESKTVDKKSGDADKDKVPEKAETKDEPEVIEAPGGDAGQEGEHEVEDE